MSEEGSVFSEENFRAMVEHAPIGILIIDRSLTWRFVNQRFCEITGYSREELAGKTFLDITFKEDIDNNLTLYHQLLDGKVNEYFFEKRYVRKDGQIIWVRLAVAGVRTDGNYSHMVVSVQDIDESKRYEKALELKNEELDLLLYKASHDLKSPVTTLSGLCNLLRHDHENLWQDESFLHLEQTVRKLQIQNEALLQITRIHDLKPAIESMELEGLIRGILKHMNVNGAEIKYTDLDVAVQTDRTLLTIALRNILENALQFRSPFSHARLLIDFVLTHGRNKITVTDNGPGIPNHEMGHIFNMFYKASESSGGSGMGLFIPKKAVEKLNGEIVVSSTPGEGSSFSLLLPTI